MSAAMFTNTCSVCGAEETLDMLILRMIDDDEARRLIADVLTMSLPVGGLVVRYLRLFKPPKQKLRMSKVAALLGELVPDMQRNAIERNGRTWLVGLDAWKAAFQAVFDAHEKGTLTPPLLGHGYLYQVLMHLADKAEAQIERETEAERRNHRQAGPASGPTTVGAALGKDPALRKLDADARTTHGMPPHIRERADALRRGFNASPSQHHKEERSAT